MERKKILIVDDEPDVIKILKFRLQQEGYDVTELYNGLEGLGKAGQGIPDLIILDVMMPKVNAYDVSRMLKFDAKYKRVPVLMLTASTQEDDEKLGLSTEVDEYISKPFSLEEVVAKINEMANNHKEVSKVA